MRIFHGRHRKHGIEGILRTFFFLLFFLPCILCFPWSLHAESLLNVVYKDDTAAAKEMLAAGASAAAANEFGVTPLSVACLNGNAELVKALLDAGADPNVTQNGGESALMTAARTGKPKPVELLLARGAKVDAIERKGQTALMWAAAEGHAEAVKLLLVAGADPVVTLKSGFNALFFSVRNGKMEVAKVLLKSGLDVNAVIEGKRSNGKAPQTGSSALILAIENGHFELATMLLEEGANPNDLRSGHSPLHVLTWVRKPNRGDGDDGMPPPIGSGKMTSLEFVDKLVEHGAKVNLRLKRGGSSGAKLNFKGATPFLMASKTADLLFLKRLLKHGADPLLSTDDGSTPLMAAAGLGTHAPTEEAGTEGECLAVVEWLLSLGADMNTVDKNGETAMHGAAYKSLPKMVHYLAEKGADISIWNQKNKRGWTPLLIAQGYRPGNFKPEAATNAAISEVMLAAGITPPPPPERKTGKKKDYNS